MEAFSMARQSKREYLRSIDRRYGEGRRKEKTAMLEEFCKICGYNRKVCHLAFEPSLVQPRCSQSCDPALDYLR
jgi:hypothetical protein